MSEWRQVQKKTYNVGIAKPPAGTVLFNDLEQVLDKGDDVYTKGKVKLSMER